MQHVSQLVRWAPSPPSRLRLTAFAGAQVLLVVPALLLFVLDVVAGGLAVAVVGCSANAFTVRVSRARSKLRGALEPARPPVASLSTSLVKEHTA